MINYDMTLYFPFYWVVLAHPGIWVFERIGVWNWSLPLVLLCC